MVWPALLLSYLVVGPGVALPQRGRTLVDLHLQDDIIRSGWEESTTVQPTQPPAPISVQPTNPPTRRRRLRPTNPPQLLISSQQTRGRTHRGKVNKNGITRKRGFQGDDGGLEERERRDISKLGRTGYGYTRDSLEDESNYGRRLGGSRRMAELRGRIGQRNRVSLKQGRGRVVPQILPLEQEEPEEEYDYGGYEDEYAYDDDYGEDYDDNEEYEEEDLVWPHEVRPSRSESELEVEGRPSFPLSSSSHSWTTVQPTQPPVPRWVQPTNPPTPRRRVRPTNPPTTSRRPPTTTRRTYPTNPPTRRAQTNRPSSNQGVEVAQGEEYRRETEQEGGDEDDCGPMCRNLVHEVGHPKEHDRCPEEGMVIDIWGYCRHIFHEERRDWAWWENLRQYEHANRNSGANNYRPTINEYSQWPGNWHSG